MELEDEESRRFIGGQSDFKRHSKGLHLVLKSYGIAIEG
jgi:hypothetical protein